jgi:hypothetical protein
VYQMCIQLQRRGSEWSITQGAFIYPWLKLVAANTGGWGQFGFLSSDGPRLIDTLVGLKKANLIMHGQACPC